MLRIEKPAPTDVRSMLLTLGVGSFVADLAIPFVWFIPGSVDPDSASIIEINKAMQRGLRKIGYGRVQVNGILDRETATALDQVSGPRGAWMQKPFVVILRDILKAMRDPDRKAQEIVSDLSGYFNYQGIAPGPLPGFMVGLPPGPLGMGATSVDAGVSLDFGQGVKSKTNIIPIPKKSGATFSAFKNLQRQINRLLSRHPKKGRIAEDGIIGKGTFDAFQKAQDVIGMSVPGDENTLEMAKHAVSIASILNAEATAMGIASTANKGVTATPASASEPTPAPMTETQAASFTVGPMAAMKKYLPFLALAGGIAWFASTKTKKKSKKGKR